MSDVIVGLDIGSNFIRTVIGEYTDTDTFQIIGLGKVLSPGLRNGTIVNIESTMNAIKQSIEDAEMDSGCEVHSCVPAIGGIQIKSWDSNGMVQVAGSKGITPREITEQDMADAIEVARSLPLPPDRQILHVVPRYYSVDKQEQVKDPKDMLGVKLEVETHVITASCTSVKNVQNCIGRAGYKAEGMMLKTLAATKAVMTKDELELGSILIDMGSGTTDVLVLLGGAPICSLSIPVGSSFITNDIVYVKGIAFDTAENTKIKYGCCWEPLLDEDEEVVIPGIGGRGPESISRRELCQIIQARVEEIFNMVRVEIVRQTKLTQLSGNVVLTGGGAQLMGIVELAQKVFKTTAVRIGTPGNFGGKTEVYRTPEYATVIGLLLGSNESRRRIDTKRNKQYNRSEDTKSKSSFLSQLGNIFKEFF